jgi:hypothetical protein
MKKLIFLFFFLCIITFSFSQTNVYHKFPTDSAMWREFTGCYPYPVYKGYQYFIKGDTIISGKEYHKILTSGVHYGVDITGGCNYNSILGSFNSYSGSLREDTLSKKVYFIPAGNQTESLLYNFNLNLNDSLYNGLTNDSINKHNYVSSVDSILVGNEYRKRFGISNMDHLFIIEGIGSTYGLISPIEYQFEYYIELFCFTQNGIPLYESSDSHSTCDAASINEAVPLQTFNISINPNPFNSTAELRLNKIFERFVIEICNLQGASISKTTYFSTDKVTIDSKGIESGLYFLKVILDSKVVQTRKIVIIE